MQEEAIGKRRAQRLGMKLGFPVTERYTTWPRPATPSCLCVILSLVLLSDGCAVGPNYHRPAVNTPESFRGQINTSTNSFGNLPWWRVFKDEALQSLIRTALTNNYDLRIAFSGWNSPAKWRRRHSRDSFPN